MCVCECVCACVCVCLCVCVGGGRGLRNVRETYKGGGGFLETYESVHGGGRSKIVKFEPTYFLNDPQRHFRPLQAEQFKIIDTVLRRSVTEEKDKDVNFSKLIFRSLSCYLFYI